MSVVKPFKARLVPALPDPVQANTWYLVKPDGEDNFTFHVVNSQGIRSSLSMIEGSNQVAPDTLGIGGAIADETNRLSVNSSDVLLNNRGEGVQVKLNKAQEDDTASFLFQTGFSGRAEIGLTGNDDFSFKVSPNGTDFFDAIIIDKNTGDVNFVGEVSGFDNISTVATLPTGSDIAPNNLYALLVDGGVELHVSDENSVLRTLVQSAQPPEPPQSTVNHSLTATWTATETWSNGDPAGLGDDVVDGNTDTYWANNNNMPVTITADLGAGQSVALTRIALARSSLNAGWNDDNFSPGKWTFEGSNDNSNWTVLDTVTGNLTPPDSQFDEFTFINTDPYRYYRMVITRSFSGSNFVSISEIQLYE